MITTGSKYLFGAAAFAMVAAWVYGWGTGGGLTGVMLFGLLGGVGELTGYTVLVTASAVLFGLGATTSIVRDADEAHQAAIAGVERAPVALPPSRASYLPAIGALSVVLLLVGLVASSWLFGAGILGVLFVTIEWMVTAWSDRATGDPATNLRIRNQVMRPFEVPIGALLAVLVVVVSFSRVFLTLEARATSITALVLGAIVLGVGFFIAYRPNLPKDAIAGLVVIGALVAIGAGIAAAAAGPREFEHHEPTHDEGGEEGEHGAADLDAGPILLESNQ